MKILKIHFKNLNSLIGEWDIDFEHPAFVHEGIFAITGPTGSGKTTILDAICLALYGATPRLGAITKGSNQIMSRQTGDCKSEVTFAINQVKYRCTWMQHRAHFRPSGELQSQKHELFNINIGKMIADTVRGVPEKVEEISGLNFQRFTRSMLLAQGNFAAFLQANANERAPILEQITGTEIYSKISIQVFEHRKTEEGLLKALLDEVSHLTILSAEELAQLQEKEAHSEQEIKALTAELANIDLSLQWLAKIDQLRLEQTSLQAEQTSLQLETEAFANDRTRLRQATLARELAVEYKTLLDGRKQLQQIKGEIAMRQQQLPESETKEQSLATNAKQATKELQDKKTAQQNSLPLIREVKQLDQKIEHQEQTCQKTANELQKLEKEARQLQLKQQRDEFRMTALLSELANLESKLLENAGDAKLQAELSGMENQIKAIKELQEQAENKQRQWQQQDKLQEHQNHQLQNMQREHAATFARQQELLDKSQHLQISREANLQGDDLPTWMGRQEEWQRNLQALEKISATLQNKTLQEQEVTRLQSEGNHLQEELAKLAVAQQQSLASATLCDEQCELLEQMQLQQSRIQSLEAERHKLIAGQACPLCGAVEHPYASQLPPLESDLGKRLLEIKQKQKQHQAILSKLNTALELNQEKRTRVQQAITDAEGKIAILTQSLRESWPGQGLDWQEDAPNKQLQTKLETLVKVNNDLSAEASKIISAELQAAATSQALQKQLDLAREALQQNANKLQKLTTESKNTKTTLRNLQAEIEAVQQNIQEKSNALIAVFQSFNIAARVFSDFAPALAQLRSRAQNFASLTTLRQQQSHLQGELSVQIKLQADSLSQLRERLSTSRQTLQEQTAATQALQQTRQQQFQDRDPVQEEDRLQKEVAAAEKLAEKARLQAQEARSKLEQLQASLQTLEQSLTLWQATLADAEEIFLHARSQKGFCAEQDYLTALLPEPEYQTLVSKAEKLKNQQISLRARSNSNQQQLALEEAKKVTGENAELLRQKQQEQAEKQAGKQQELGAMRQILAENQRQQTLLAEKQEKIDRQRQELQRWDNLNELIGSADGKKYRNIVQGMTFDIVIGLANKKLEKLTGRYQLVRSQEQLLELNVIDHYQAGETRSCKNLSGGESFIVSLALALGLAQMASHKIRVDSLFLDEGFGTLDEAALDQALDTLASLQQDGKLIGIISHVQAIKTRINTQLQVVKLTGGKSRLEQPWLN